MNLICPHCQKLVAVPDQNAGQSTNCPFCQQAFQVPALPAAPTKPPVLEDLPADIPLVPLPQAPEPAKVSSPPVLPSPAPSQEEEFYRVAPEPPKPIPPKPAPTPPRREERVAPPPQPTPVVPTIVPAAAPLTGGYTHASSIRVNPHVISWMVPVALCLVFVLQFSPWTGIYPGGYRVYKQRGFGSIGGYVSDDPVGVKALNGVKPFDPEAVSGNWSILFYFLLVLAALVLAALPLVSTHTTVRLPAAVQHVLPWRLALLLCATLVAFLLLLAQLWMGFGLENAVAAEAARSMEKERNDAKTSEDQEIVDIHQGLLLDRWNLHRSWWLRLAVLCHFAALVGVALEFWLERRGPRPLPRLDVQW